MTDIVYDGGLAERRLRVLEKMRSLSTDGTIHERIEEARKHLLIKEEYKQYVEEYDIGGYIYFDVVLGGYVYDVITVGKYGMGIVGETSNQLFEKLEDVYELATPDDLANIKNPLLFSKAKQYNDFVVNNMSECSITQLVGEMVEITRESFIRTELWQELDTRRLLLAERIGTAPHMIYRVVDVVELLNLAPEGPVPSVNINIEYQKVILKAWKNFLQ